MSLRDLQRRRQELGIAEDQNPPTRYLRFNADRKWVSISDPGEFLAAYASSQESKYEPPVFASEPRDDPGTQEFQRRRRQYYEAKGRLDRLQTLESVKAWPYKFGIPTRAPFIACSENAHVENADNRNLPVFRVFAIPELAIRILSHVPYFRSLVGLSSSSWTGFNVIQASIEHWNLTELDYLQNNKIVADKAYQPSPQILVVSPVRPLMDKTNRVRKDSTFVSEFSGLWELFWALNNRSHTIVNLQLHRMPFLEMGAVECIVASLPNLKTLGIYQCPLLHFGTTGKLLDIIEKYPKSSGFAHLDFFPVFHQGPNVSNRKGSFGVTWEDPGLNTAAAIVKLVLYEYYPKARKLGIDLFDDTGVFRLWLEKCPLPDWTVVRVHEAIKTYEKDRKLGLSGEAWMQDKDDAAFGHMADDVAAAIFTDDTEPGIVPQAVMAEILAVRRKGETLVGDQYRAYNWWRAQSAGCRTCTQTGPILESFFPFYNDKMCYGCRLISALDQEEDHMKTWLKRSAVRWLGDKSRPYNFRTLGDALTSEHWRDGIDFARRADIAFRFEKRHRYDPSTKDLLWHVDYTSLARRWHRDREPHGGIDRRRHERQYIPVGEENISVGLELVTPEFFFANIFSDEKEEAIAERVSSRPDAYRYGEEEFRDEVRRLQSFNVRRRVDLHDKEGMAELIEGQCSRDRQQILLRHRLWQSLVRRPNRPAANWDEMRGRMLLEMEREANGGELPKPKKDVRQWTDTLNRPV